MIELKRHVEGIVRPLPANYRRKITMREELYAHLLDAYQAELSAGAAPDKAEERALARLGDPLELRNQLKASVPWWEYYPEGRAAWLSRRPGESALPSAGRVAALMTAFFLFDLILVPLF